MMTDYIDNFREFYYYSEIPAELEDEQCGNDYKVYFIDDGKYIKIGIAKNVKSRLATLQTASYGNFTLRFVIHCSGEKEAKEAEQYLHNLFREKNVNREWFDIRAILQSEYWDLEFDGMNIFDRGGKK